MPEAELRRLLHDYLDARGGLLSEFSGAWDQDAATLYADGQARATALGLEWTDDLMPPEWLERARRTDDQDQGATP